MALSGSSSADLRLPLYQRLRDELAARIAEQVWRPGDALPSETALAEAHGVSPGTMRKAIEVLVAEGLLERRQGKGTFVRKASFDASLFRFFRFQSRAGERMVPESRILKREVVPAPSEVARKLLLTEETPVIHVSRLRLFGAEPGLAEDIWLPFEPFAAFMEVEINRIGDLLYPVYESVCGLAIAFAQENLTAETVDEAYARLLRVSPGMPVIVIERLAFGFAQEPLEWRRSRGRADKFQYNIEIR